MRPSSIRNVPSRVVPVNSAGALVDDVQVPQARDVEAALDRRAQRLLVLRAAAGQDEVRRVRARSRSRRGRARGRSSAPRRRRGRPSACRARRAWATPSWISGSGRLGTPSASKARGSVRGKRGASERLIDECRHPSAQAAGQRAAALCVRRPAERGRQRRRAAGRRRRPRTRRGRPPARADGRLLGHLGRRPPGDGDRVQRGRARRRSPRPSPSGRWPRRARRPSGARR